MGHPACSLNEDRSVRQSGGSVQGIDKRWRQVSACSAARTSAILLEDRRTSGYHDRMPDDLYHRDALAWSEQQAALLRRVARGERVNEVDWNHVVEEIEDVGLFELNAVRSYLSLVLVHLLKLHGWPEMDAGQHWRSEIVAFQGNLADRFAPSMRQRIDLAGLYDRARRQVALISYAGKPPRLSPAVCPMSLDDLMTASCKDLVQAIAAGSATP
jgi:hypothetical protein